MNIANCLGSHPPQREQLYRQPELGRRELRGGSPPQDAGKAHQPRSLTMRYLLANAQPSPRLRLLLTALLAAFRQFKAVSTGLALLRRTGLLRAPYRNRLAAPSASCSPLP